MKKLLSLLLAVSMVCSTVFAPAAYAEEATPAPAELALEAGDDGTLTPSDPVAETPAPETPAEETPAEETPAPEEPEGEATATPAPATQAPEATPTPTPEVTPTPAPTETPAPTATPEPTQVPAMPAPQNLAQTPADAEIQTESNNETEDAAVSTRSEVTEDSILLYYDAEADVYFGKLPAEPNEEGFLEISGGTLYWESDASTGYGSYDWREMLYQNDAYWLFLQADQAPAEGTAFAYTVKSDGETGPTEHPVVFSTETPAERPTYMYSKASTSWSSFQFTPQNMPVQAGQSYTFQVKPYSAGWTLLGIEGQGVQITSQPDADGNFTIYYPDTVKNWVTEGNQVRARLWLYAQDENGALQYNEVTVPNYPGQVYTGAISGSANWANLTSEEGAAFTPSFYTSGTSITSWAELGTVDSDGIQVELKNQQGEAYTGTLTAAYDAQSDKVLVKIDSLPDTDQTWYLSLHVPFVEGFSLESYTWSVSKERLSLSADSIDQVLGTKAGATFRTQIKIYNDQTYQYVNFTSTDPWTATLSENNNMGKIELAEGETLSDYVDLSFDAATGILTATAKKDITLADGQDYVSLYVDMTGPTQDGGLWNAISVGMPQVSLNQIYPNWQNLTDSQGVDLAPYTYDSTSGTNVADWSQYGTPTGEVSAKLATYDGSVDWSDHLTVAYNPDKQTINVKVDTLPEDISGSWRLTLYIACSEGYTLFAQQSVNKASLQIDLQDVSGLGNLGLTAGSTMTCTVTDTTDYSNKKPLLLDDSWTITLNAYSGNFVMGADETINDYVQAQAVDGKLVLTVLKDLTLQDGMNNGTIRVSLDSKTATVYGDSITVGAANLSISLQNKDGYSAYVTLIEGQSATLYPGIYRNNAFVRLPDLGLDYAVEIYANNSPMENWQDYFDLTMENDGGFTVTVRKVPPIYNFETNSSIDYRVKIVSTAGNFVSNSLPGFTSMSTYQVKLRQNGSTVYTLPAKAGTYVYDLALIGNNSANPEEVELPSGVQFTLGSDMYGDNWNSTEFAGKYTLSLDTTAKKLTYTVLEDLDNAVSLSIHGYWGDQYYFTDSIDVGRTGLNLEFYRSDSHSNTFSETNTQFTIVADTGHGYLPANTLPDENFTLSTVENGTQVPLAESQYFDAAIENGVLTVTIKQRPETTNSYSYGIRVAYEDDAYTTQNNEFVYYAPLNTSSTYYSLQFSDMATGISTYRIPAGVPGTTDSYRVLSSDSQYAAEATGGALTGFVTGTTAPLDISDYVNITYNPTNSVLSFEWLKELPLRSEDGSVAYSYTLEPQGIQSSTVQLFGYDGSVCETINGNMASPITVRPGASSQYVVGYPIRPDTLWYSVTDENDQPVGEDMISLATNDFGGFTVTAGADCPEGVYTLDVSALLAYNGGDKTLVWRLSSYSKLTILVTTNTTDITYEMMYRASYGYSRSDITAGSTIAIFSDIFVPHTLRLPENSMATDFTIEGLTLGTATKVEAGVYELNFDAANLGAGQHNEELTLTATLADGTRESCTVTLQVNVPDLSFRVTDGDNTYETGDVFADSIWVVGKEYQITPLLDGNLISTMGATLESAFLTSDEYYEITEVTDDSFTVVPQRSYSGNEYSNSYTTLFLNLRLASGDARQYSRGVDIGTIIASGTRLQFVNTDTDTLVNSITAYPWQQDFTLRLNETLGAGDTVTYGTTVPDTVTWEAVPGETGTVKVHVADYLGYSDNYFYAIVTRQDGSQTSAYVDVNWNSYSTDQILPTGQEIYFGTKGEDNAYDHWDGTSMTRMEGTTSTSKLYVFFGQNYNGTTVYEDWPSCVEGIEVTSSNPDMLRINRQLKENGMWFFEYQCDKSQYGNYTITATVQLTDGTTRKSDFRVTVMEAPQRSQVTVHNGDELKQALASATLLPGMYVYAEPGTYDGDFVMDMPVLLFAQNATAPTYNADGSLKPRENGAVINGSVTVTTQNGNIAGFDFVGDGTGTAVIDAQIVQRCTFTNYDIAVEMERDVYNSDSPTVSNNAFVDNNTAILFGEHEWYTYLGGNTFWHNDTALHYPSECTITGEYSPSFQAMMTRGSMIRNRFYLEDGQMVLVNDSRNQATINLTYNYFEQAGTAKPRAAMFDGPAVYSPYYETAAMSSVTTDESLEDNLEEGTTTSVLTLTAAQGSSNTNTADSALQLSDSKFEELRESDKVTDLQINVQSTSNETDVVWNFAKEDLKEDYQGDSVNLGVAFTFTDFEYDTINEIVRKTQEEWDTPSETLGSIAYQAMCFSHSGDLPGTATVKVRMNESLLDYYATHGNSMADFKIYYFNEDTGALEKMDRDIQVVEENGTYYMQFQIDHCSSYLVTPEKLLEDVSGFIEIILNAANNGGYTLVDAILNRVMPGTTVQEVLSHLSGGAMTVRDLQNNVVSTDSAIGTGYTIGLGDGTTAPIQVVIGGDLTGNGTIDADDLLQMRRAVLKLVTLDGVWLKAATPIGQGTMPSDQDLLQMRRILLNLADSMYLD